ncbi:hypothetical protein BDZ91DRAFT_305464 [Kalaharituber pfeilii]|nr:hypothetical protein BDZ91DRAFT_305464 [Kalaharituber pfeilii]
MRTVLLAAQFAGPTAAREFVGCCVIVGEGWLGENEGDGRKKAGRKSRELMLISRPVTGHPECGPRNGYTRGVYESVEYIREVIPEWDEWDGEESEESKVDTETDGSEEMMEVGIDGVGEVTGAEVEQDPTEPTEKDFANVAESQLGHKHKMRVYRHGQRHHRRHRCRRKSPVRSNSAYNPQSSNYSTPDEQPPPSYPHKLAVKPKSRARKCYPVEWVMLTRSDPGGNVPRWMVERGTPGGS